MRRLAVAAILLLAVAASAHAEGMPQLDFANPLMLAQIVWATLIFVGLYLLLGHWALPQLGSVLQLRADTIAADLDAARAAKAQADGAVAEMTTATRDAQARAQAEVNDAVTAARAQQAEQAATLGAELDRQLAEAEQRIGAARQAAMGALREVAGDAAGALVSRLTGRSPEPAGLIARCPTRWLPGLRRSGKPMEEHHGFFGDPRTWVAAAFVIFFIIFGRTLRKAVVGMLDKRAETVRAELAEATRLRKEAEALLADATARREAAMTEASRVLESAKAEAARVAATTAEETRAAAARRERMALDRIAAAEKQAVTDVRLAAADVAASAAARLIREDFGADADRELVDHAIRRRPVGADAAGCLSTRRLLGAVEQSKDRDRFVLVPIDDDVRRAVDD